MAVNKPEIVFKILLIGDSGVGKSSFLVRYVDDEFEDGRSCTIGVDFKTKTLEQEGKKISLSIWDTAGQEKFRSLTSSYYRGTHGIILVYDVGKRQTYESVSNWLEEVETFTTLSNVVVMLVGNKIDQEHRQVTREEATKFAKSRNMIYVECSAKTKLGVDSAFLEIVTKILETPSLWEPKNKSTISTSKVNLQPQEEEGGSYCC